MEEDLPYQYTLNDDEASARRMLLHIIQETPAGPCLWKSAGTREAGTEGDYTELVRDTLDNRDDPTTWWGVWRHRDSDRFWFCCDRNHTTDECVIEINDDESPS